MSSLEHEKASEPKLEYTDVVGALSIVESTFRNYRKQLLEVAGNIDFTEKDDRSLVTALDLEIEKSVQHEIKAQYSTMAVYGEETGYGAGTDTAFWLIDPIDGTKSFIDGLSAFSNMAAFIENGETRAAIIYNPTRDDVYTAIRGGGACKNGVAIDIATINPMNVVLCKNEFIDEIETILAPAQIHAESPPSGGGDGFTKILDGLVAARFQMHASGYAHDYAPGALLVSEAGGVIIPIKDDHYTYESQSFAACHPKLAELITQNVDRLKVLDN